MVNPTKIIPNKSSSAAAWMEWHKALKSRYGKKQANALFVTAWEKRGSNAANTMELREYMKDNDVDLGSNTVQDVLDFTSGGIDTIGDMFTIGKYLTIGVAVIVVGGLGMLIFNLAKQPIKALESVKTLK